MIQKLAFPAPNLEQQYNTNREPSKAVVDHVSGS